jgi:hypothetical protein
LSWEPSPPGGSQGRPRWPSSPNPLWRSPYRRSSGPRERRDVRGEHARCSQPLGSLLLRPLPHLGRLIRRVDAPPTVLALASDHLIRAALFTPQARPAKPQPTTTTISDRRYPSSPRHDHPGATDGHQLHHEMRLDWTGAPKADMTGHSAQQVGPHRGHSRTVSSGQSRSLAACRFGR